MNLNDIYIDHDYCKLARHVTSTIASLVKVMYIGREATYSNCGPKNLPPLIWGYHHQLDDQHQEPMVNTKIILLGN